jgi:hypothetical protein
MVTWEAVKIGCREEKMSWREDVVEEGCRERRMFLTRFNTQYSL